MLPDLIMALIAVSVNGSSEVAGSGTSGFFTYNATTFAVARPYGRVIYILDVITERRFLHTRETDKKENELLVGITDMSGKTRGSIFAIVRQCER